VGRFALLPRTWYPSPSSRVINFLSRSCIYACLTVSGEMPSCLPSDCVEGSEAPGLSLPLLIESFICRKTCAFTIHQRRAIVFNYLLLNALRDARFYTQQSALKAEDIDRTGQDYLMWRELLNRLQRWEGLHDVQERANAGH